MESAGVHQGVQYGRWDRFATSVALSADGWTLAVGAFAEASSATGVGGNQVDNSAGNAGVVYVFISMRIQFALYGS